MPFNPTITIALCLLAQCVLINAAEPGLILHFADADARLARQVALFVPEGEAASAFTSAQPVRATWHGTLNLEARSRLIFTLEGSGAATLSIDDEILCAKLATPSDRKRLSSGEHPVKIEYTGPVGGDAQLRLFWEGRDFGKEPVPASAFTHDEGDALLLQQTQLRLGHELIEQHHCNSCHGDSGNSNSPSLDDLGSRIETAWLARWIANPRALRPSAHMPAVLKGDDVEQQAVDIALFLQREAAASVEVPEDKDGNGARLFHEQGCIGCHTLGEKGDDQRISLGQIGQKFLPGALAEFLRGPAKNHASTRMPDFGFDDAESAALESFLRSLTKKQTERRPEGNPLRGAQLFKQSGCLNCHQSGDLKSELPQPEPATAANCSAADFGFSEAEQQAITAALTSTAEPRRITAEIAQRSFTTMRCAACHERDGQLAYRDSFAAEVAHLVANEEGARLAKIPNLTQLGSKLRPEWRTELFKGGIKPKTRPWLKARMPAFGSRSEMLSAGFSHAAGLPAKTQELPDPDAEKVKIGAALAGTSGFACATCHGIGDQKAIAVFEGEGPNFRDAGSRLLPDYFQLWMSDPPRMWPGTIMPNYTSDGKSPLTQHYDGDAGQQFDAIYDYLRSLSK